MAVTVMPMPESYKKITKKIFRPCPPPRYDSPPTAEDRELAQALLDALDQESKDWYSGAWYRNPA